VEILGIVLDPGEASADVIYRIRWLCCGRVGEMPHPRITERERRTRHARARGTLAHVARCMRCHAVYRRAKRRDFYPETRPKPRPEPDYGVTLPVWPRPPSIAPGYWRWEGPR
jgi:hypothetical protein